MTLKLTDSQSRKMYVSGVTKEQMIYLVIILGRVGVLVEREG